MAALHKLTIVPLLIGASTVALTAPARAQQQPEAEEGNSQEIIVTAQKRAENVRDVPISIAVLGDQALVKNRVQSVEDVAKLVPGLEVGVGFGRQSSSLSIRGVAPQTFNSATVVAFVDGFTTGLRTDVTSELFDLERVEVLKGPQATLYGRNAIGGTINYITKKPLNVPEMRLQLVGGGYGTYAARVSASGPLVHDVLAVRVSASATGRDGYFDNALTGEENADGTSDKSVRLALRLTPGDRFESNFALSFSRSEDDCGDCVQSIPGFDPANPALLGQGAYDVNDPVRTINHEIPTAGFKRSVYTGVWTNSLNLAAANLTSITGYSEQDLYQELDFNRLPGPLNFGFPVDSGTTRGHRRIFSQELRLASDGDGPFNWLIGAYYYHAKSDSESGLNTPFGSFVTADTLETTKNYAAFVNGTFKITDRLNLDVGLRYDYEKSRLGDNLAVLPDAEVSSSEFLPRASLTYAIDDRNNVYATVSRGYHSGGLNPCADFGAGMIVCPPELSVGPEYIWNYELGFKGGAGSRLNYSVAAYYIDWTNQQVTSTTGVLTYLDNAGQTEIYGVEGELRYEVSPQFNLSLAANYNHARFKDFLDQSGIPPFFGVSPQRAGARPLLAPDFSGYAGAEFRQPVGDGFDITANAGARYTGKRSLDSSGVSVADGYLIADFSLSVGNPNFRLTAFVTNAFDTNYASYLQLFSFPGIAPLIHAGSPRVFGLQLDADF